MTIHPWADGNGRMARLIMNYLQFEFNLIPSKIIKEDKSEYIQSLVDSRDQEDAQPFYTFMMTEHIRNLKREMTEFKKSQQE